jgi:hypothetical protein
LAIFSAFANTRPGNGSLNSPTDAVIVAKPVVGTVTVVVSEDEPHAVAANAATPARTAAPLERTERATGGP